MITLRRKGANWQANVYLVLPDGRRYRERRIAPIASKEGAFRWAQELERKRLEELLTGRGARRGEVPTLAAFVTRVPEDAPAERLAPSTIRGKETSVRCHLVPVVGALRLDAIGPAEIARLKAELARKTLGAKTTNNVLCDLSTLLKKAEEWGIIGAAPRVKLLWVPKPGFRFLDFDEW